MTSLATWFPSVGTFAIVVAVSGSLVSIHAFRGWKRIRLAVVFVLLGVGEVVSIVKADRSHELEVRHRHSDLETLANNCTNRKCSDNWRMSLSEPNLRTLPVAPHLVQP